jgi:signal transduction histidine kinase
VQLHQDVAVIANEAESVAQAFRAVLDRLCGFTGWPIAHVFLQCEDDPAQFGEAAIWSVREGVDGSALIEALRGRRASAGTSLAGQVIASGRACWGNAVDKRGPYEDRTEACPRPWRHVLAFPVLIGDEVAAVVEFFAINVESPDENLMDAMRLVERRRLQQELIGAVWEQQREFGQEIHDTLGQELTGIAMVAESIARKLASRDAPGAQTVQELARMIQQAKQGTRRLAKGLLPVEVDAEGLSAALEELAETTRLRCRIDVRVRCDRSLHLDDNHVATHLFRIAQEAVTNAVKHAEATQIGIDLSGPPGALVLTVDDDGSGIMPSPRKQSRGVGLRIMGYRAQLIGAQLDIQPGPQGGTRVACRLERKN